jgi:hypothetical protein
MRFFPSQPVPPVERTCYLGCRSLLAKAVDGKVDKTPEFATEILDVDSCSSVNFRWILSSQEGNAHQTRP